jgi:hypothetical protein
MIADQTSPRLLIYLHFLAIGCIEGAKARKSSACCAAVLGTTMLITAVLPTVIIMLLRIGTTILVFGCWLLRPALLAVRIPRWESRERTLRSPDLVPVMGTTLSKNKTESGMLVGSPDVSLTHQNLAHRNSGRSPTSGVGSFQPKTSDFWRSNSLYN